MKIRILVQSVKAASGLMATGFFMYALATLWGGRQPIGILRDFVSRIAIGRVAEIVGEKALPVDRLMRRIQSREAELEEYKKKLAEQVLINDFLKKLQTSRASQS